MRAKNSRRIVRINAYKVIANTPSGDKITYAVPGEGTVSVKFGNKPARRVAQFPSQTQARKAMNAAASAAASGDYGPTLALRYS